GGAYGNEQRFCLRTPVPYMVPAALVWVAHTGSILTGVVARAAARITVADGGAEITWETPQRRISPGQSVVFYDATDTAVLGGGIVAG
ncbi:MAG: aminomethyltransferase beta-barrel domain-containing protein, partial [Actinomycetota bacterium]